MGCNPLIFNAKLRIAWLVLLFLGGCASVAPELEDPDFVLGGKIGIQRTELDGRDAGGSARFQWVQRGDYYEIDLWGAFGQGRTRLTGTAQEMQVTDGAGDVLLAGPPAEVMLERLGWSLPVAVLPAWLWGLPAPGYPVQGPLQDEEERLAGFSQLDWQLNLSDYRVIDPLEARYPRRLVLKRPGFSARIVVAERSGNPLI